MLDEDLAMRISALLAQRPLPETAEADLDTLISEAPEEMREILRRDLGEALFTARQAESFTGVGGQRLSF